MKTIPSSSPFARFGRSRALAGPVSGGLVAALRRRIAAPTLVLLYHRVLPTVTPDVNRLAVSSANFAAHLSYLARRAFVIGEDGLLERLERRRISSKPHVLITFDDGYADNVEHALPILRRHGMSAILFVTVDAVAGGGSFWWDRLQQVVFNGHDLDVTGDDPVVRRYAKLHQELKPLSLAARCAALAALERRSGISTSGATARSMNWDELRRWCAAGMHVGGHTRTHPQLSACTDDELQTEIAGCKRDLERNLAKEVRTFAYPFGGKQDFDQRAAAAVRTAGYRCALANREGRVSWARSRFALPRCLVRDWTAEAFAAQFERWCR